MGKTIGSRIRSRRKALGIRQADIEELTGIPERTFQDYERDRSSIPHDRLFAISRILACDPNELDPEYKPQRPSNEVEKIEVSSAKEILKEIQALRSEIVKSGLHGTKSIESFDFDPKDVVERLQSLPPNTRKILLALIYQDPSLAEGTTVDSSLLSLMSQLGRESSK